jgi:pilus assembly protein CpaB
MQPRQQTGGRTKALLIFGISLAAAVAAVFLVFRVVQLAQQEVAKAREAPSTVEVVVAARDLNVGVTIGDGDVVVRSLAAEMVPTEGVFHTAEEMGIRVPRERILANEIVRDERLALADAGIGLNAIVSPGKRAMSVAVDAETGVAGFIQPGNYVDVIVTIRPDDADAEKRWASKAFLQGIKVLAVGERTDASKTGPNAAKSGVKAKSSREKPTVTLELELAQAEELALSSTRGDIHLVLRNDIDITEQDTQGSIASRLVGAPTEVAKAPTAKGKGKGTTGTSKPPPPTGPVSEIITGSQVEEVQFDKDGTKSVTVQPKRQNR